MNLSGMSAVKCCEMILAGNRLEFFASELLQKRILTLGGKYFKTSNLERRCRDSSSIRSKLIKSNGTKYAIYGYVEQQGELI